MSSFPEFNPLHPGIPSKVLDRVASYLQESDFEAKVLLFVGFFLAGYSTLDQQALNGPAASFWAPTGIAIAAFMLRGASIWPVVFCAAFLVDAINAGSFFAALVVAAGQTLEGWIAWYLANDWADKKSIFFNFELVLKFCLFSVPLAAMVSATIGVATYCALGYTSWYALGSVWLTWWQGDVAGGIVVAPLIVLLVIHRHHTLDIGESAGLLLTLVGLVFVCVVAFCRSNSFDGNGGRLIIFMVPLLIWIAARYCPLEDAIANAIVTGITIWSSVHNYGPFSSSHVPSYIVNGFVVTLCVTSLAISALFAEKREDQESSLIRDLVVEDTHKSEIKSLNETIDTLRTASAIQSAARRLVTNTDAALQELLLNIPEVIRIVDLATNRNLYVSPAVESLFLRSSDEFYRNADSWVSHVHGSDQARIAKVLAPGLRGSGQNSFELSYRIVRPSGSIRWVLDRGMFVRDGLGAIVRIVAIASDITEIKDYFVKSRGQARTSWIASQFDSQT
jgi:PAS domain S-box-containing protein